MQTPRRKPGKYIHRTLDPHLTDAKFLELTSLLEKLKTSTRPHTTEEVQRLAEMGDFSDNVAYSMAKGRLRSINQQIHELEKQLESSIIINPGGKTETVQIGSRVTIETGGERKTYLILGSSETNPPKGMISHNSPMGFALLGHKVGDTVEVPSVNKVIACRVVAIG